MGNAHLSCAAPGRFHRPLGCPPHSLMTSAETTLPGSRPCDAEPRGTPGVPGRHGWTAVASSCSTCSTAKARVLEEKAPRLSERPGEGRRWESGRERGKGGNRQCRRPQEEALAGVLRFGIQSVFCPPALLTPTINTAEARCFASICPW